MFEPQGQDLLFWALTGGILISSARLAWVDLRRLEIELETLAVLALLAVAQSYLYDGLFDTCIRVFACFAFWGMLAFGGASFKALKKFGAGDPPLIGVIALLVAPQVLQWALLAAGLMLLTCWWYARRRGKRPFKSMFPAAPPLLAAGVIVYMIRITT